MKVLSEESLPVSKVSNLTAGYRVVANLTSPGKAPRKLYFDVVLVGRGSTLSEITMTSFVAPVPAKVENALAQLVASRIGAPDRLSSPRAPSRTPVDNRGSPNPGLTVVPLN